METREWAALLKSIPGRVVVVDSTSASFPFIERLAGRKRIVITATDSAAQRFDTVFPEYFIRALTDHAADLDKDGRVSVWEAFIAASAGVRRYYEQRGQLATERALLDDNGDGQGREAGATVMMARARGICTGAGHPRRAAAGRRTAVTPSEAGGARVRCRRAETTTSADDARRVPEGIRAVDDRAVEGLPRNPA